MADLAANTKKYNAQGTALEEFFTLIVDATSLAPSTTEGNITIKFLSSKVSVNVRNKSPTNFILPLESTPMNSFYNLNMIETILKIDGYMEFDSYQTLYTSFIQEADAIYMGVKMKPDTLNTVKRIFSGSLKSFNIQQDKPRYIAKYFEASTSVLNGVETTELDQRYQIKFVVPISFEFVVGVRL